MLSPPAMPIFTSTGRFVSANGLRILESVDSPPTSGRMTSLAYAVTLSSEMLPSSISTTLAARVLRETNGA